MKERIAVCPGSFDPVTLGHLDIIKRASSLFDKVIVVIMKNQDKHYSFTPEERKVLIEKSIPKEIKNVSVDISGGLLAEYAAQKNASVIIKGLRAMSDFEYEFQMALTNKKLNPDVETLFITTSTENMYLSSSMVKQITSLGGDIKDFVPAAIHDDIVKRLSSNQNV